MKITLEQEEAAIDAICSLPLSLDPINQATTAIRNRLGVDRDDADSLFQKICEQGRIRSREIERWKP